MSKGKWRYGYGLQCNCGTVESEFHVRTGRMRTRCDCPPEERSRRLQEQTRADLRFIARKQAEHRHGKELAG